jgi:membrane fusion protein (multidrug efflux system)
MTSGDRGAVRRFWSASAICTLVFSSIGYGAYREPALRVKEVTDDAYVSGNVVPVIPQIAGIVVAIDADNTQFVQAGQPVLQLDRADARIALDQAEARLARTVRDVQSRSRADRTAVDNHPDVLNAAAAVRVAYLEYARTSLPAPVSGFVAQRSVQLGEHVDPGMPLMAIISLDQVWVDANFKETQLAFMRVGQPVSLTADLYGRSVAYHGRVVGFNPGTGSAFSSLSAQGATGNWNRMVQRVSVRIALDPTELAANPLQIGLSMKAQVDTRKRDGARLPQLAQNVPAYSTDVFSAPSELAARRVRAIIARNRSEAPPQREPARSPPGYEAPACHIPTVASIDQ